MADCKRVNDEMQAKRFKCERIAFSMAYDGRSLVALVEAARLVRTAQSYERRAAGNGITKEDLERDAEQLYMQAAHIALHGPEAFKKDARAAFEALLHDVSERLGRDYSWMVEPLIEGIEAYQHHEKLTPGQVVLLEAGRSVDELTNDIELKTLHRRKNQFGDWPEGD